MRGFLNTINPAEFNQVIEINKIEFSQNDFGIPVETETLLAKTRAKVTNVKSMDNFIGDNVVYNSDLKFTIRFQRSFLDLNSNSTITFNNQTYDVVSINNIKQSNVYIELIGRLKA